ncbi:MAG: hypothetical protein MJ162_04950 [Treponema sp.]|nr:hypothetical protein [Treponema sp.]
MALRYEEQIYVSVKVIDKTADENSPPQTITATFDYINNSNKLQNSQKLNMVYRDGEDNLRTKCTDYDIIRVDIKVSIDGVEKELSALVK